MKISFSQAMHSIFHQRKYPILSNEVLSLVEHLENSSPLIIEEVRRWRDLFWDDYLYRERRATDVDNPLGL